MKRVTELIEPVMLDELLRLGKVKPRWMDVVVDEPPKFKCVANTTTWLKSTCRTGADYVGLYVLSRFVADGPKVVEPFERQCEAMRHVAIELELTDLSMPYDTVAVVMPTGWRYRTVFVHRYSPQLLLMVLHSHDHLDDVTTVVHWTDGRHVERSLETLYDDLDALLPETLAAQRVALNCCLLLSNYGHDLRPALPKELQRDEGLAASGGERGHRAAQRVSLALQVASFSRDVVFERHAPSTSTGTSGREMPPHWVRGHWRMQAHGAGNLLRKRLFVAPYMARADLFVGRPSDTVTVVEVQA